MVLARIPMTPMTPMRTKPAAGPLRQRQTGLTLVEAMVSILISLMLLAGIVQVFINSKQNYAFQRALNEMNESIRFASGQLEYHLRMAGYWAGALDVEFNTVAGSPTNWNNYIAGCDDNLPGISPSNARVPGLYFVSQASLGASGGCVSRDKVATLNDTLVIAYADPFPFPETGTGVTAADNYLRVNIGGRAVLANWPTANGGNGQFSSDSDLDDAARENVNNHRFRYFQYFVTDCGSLTITKLQASGACEAADVLDHPVLRRIVIRSAQPAVVGNIESIAWGVEYMTFTLIVDQAGIGDTVNFMTTEAVRTSTTLGDNAWETVRAVQYQLLVRATRRDVNALADTSTYPLLNGQNAVIDTSANEHLFPRRLVTGIVQLRNNAVTL